MLEQTAAHKQDMIARVGEAGVKVMMQSSVRSAAKVFEALAGAGRLDEARALADQIMQFDASDETKTLLQTHATRAGHRNCSLRQRPSRSATRFDPTEKLAGIGDGKLLRALCDLGVKALGFWYEGGPRLGSPVGRVVPNRRIGFSRENGSKPNVTYYVSFPLRNAEFRSEKIGAMPGRRNVAALERSDNVADRDHAFAMLKRGYARSGHAFAVLKRGYTASLPDMRLVIVQESWLHSRGAPARFFVRFRRRRLLLGNHVG